MWQLGRAAGSHGSITGRTATAASAPRDPTARVAAGFFLGSRLLRRLDLGLSTLSHRRRGSLALLNAAGAALDALAAARIRSAPPGGYGWRIPADVADQALWESVLGPDADAPAWGQLGLAAESTIRDGAHGMAAPAAVFAASSAVRRIRGGRWRPDLAVWPLTGAVEGLLWKRGRSAHARHVVETLEQRLAARAEAAHLSGQASVAMGADSVVDAIEGLAPILGPPPRDSALHRLLDAWKASLAVRTASVGTYLGVAVAKWARRRNLHPDLSSHVDAHLAVGDGTIVLTGTQVSALDSLLDAAAPAGRVEVRADAPPGHLPGRALLLRVDGAAVPVPADPAHRPSRYDLTPVALATAVPGCLGVSRRSGGGVPLAASLPGAAAFAAGAVWAATAGARLSPTRRGEVAVALSLGAAALHGPASARLQRHPIVPDGRANTPHTYSLEVPAFLLGYHWDSLQGRARVAAVVAAAGLHVAGLALLPGRLQRRVIISESAYLTVVVVRRALVRPVPRGRRHHAGTRARRRRGRGRRGGVQGGPRPRGRPRGRRPRRRHGAPRGRAARPRPRSGRLRPRPTRGDRAPPRRPRRCSGHPRTQVEEREPVIRRRVVVVDDNEITRVGTAALLSTEPGIDLVAALDHRRAAEWSQEWDDIDVVVVDAADERLEHDQFPGVAIVRRYRDQRPAGDGVAVVLTGHYFDDAVRLRMREAGADFFYSRTDALDRETLVGVVLRPDEARRVPPPLAPETLSSLGIGGATDVNAFVDAVEQRGAADALSQGGSMKQGPAPARSRWWLRLRRDLASTGRLRAVNREGGPPRRSQEVPSVSQIRRLYEWATKPKGPGAR